MRATVKYIPDSPDIDFVAKSLIKVDKDNRKIWVLLKMRTVQAMGEILARTYIR